MKSAVETLNPTRVRLTVEVAFDELKPSLEEAYKRIAQQVNIPGFRKGKVPPRIIDQRFGRAVVLEEAVNDALPQFYGQALEESKVQPLGQPEVDVQEFGDGQDLRFTAEVDIRPEITLPEYEGLEVTVDDIAVADEEIDKEIEHLRDRFAVLAGVDRAAQADDNVTIDLAATVGGEEIEDAKATGMSYQVGSDTLLDGIDDAITGLKAGEAKTFQSKLLGGDLEGQDADVSVIVTAVKEKQLPALDDEFAQTASEFDTLEELRADTRARLERAKKAQQGNQARDKVLEALLVQMEIPVPDGVVHEEVHWREQSIDSQLQMAGLSKDGYLEHEGKSHEEFHADLEERAREAVKAQFVLDAVAEKEQLSVGEGELSEHIVRRAWGTGLTPDQFAQQIVESGRVGELVSEVVRGKALSLLVEGATVKDASGNVVDLKALEAELAPAGETVAADEAEAAEEPEPVEG